jgi:hypothetical protein
LHLENRKDRIVKLFYYCFAIWILAWLLRIFVIQGERKGWFKQIATIIFLLLRKFGVAHNRNNQKEEFVADSSWIKKSALPSLGGSNCGKPFVGKDPDNGKQCHHTNRRSVDFLRSEK